MKILLSILFLFVSTKECKNKSALSSQNDTLTITYQAVSRGYFEEISVSKDSFTICNDINRKAYQSYTCPEADWKASLALLDNIDTSTLSELKAPTSKRFYDGAAHATLTIKNGDSEIKSSTFDHGHPPEEIKALVEKLLSFKKIASKQ